MTFLIRAVAVITLLGLSPLAFGDPGWETNLMVTINAKTVGYADSNAWLSVLRRDNWNEQDEHNAEQWQAVIGNTTKYKLFQYGVGYRYLTGDQSTEHRPHIFLTPQITAFDSQATFSIRNQLEYRIIDNEQDGFWYRFKPFASYNIPVTPNISVSPFIGDEFTYSMIDGEWTVQKLEVGLTIAVNNTYTITPYYEYKSDMQTNVDSASLFGIAGAVSF